MKKFKVPKELDRVFKAFFPIIGICLIIACLALILLGIKTTLPFN